MTPPAGFAFRRPAASTALLLIAATAVVASVPLLRCDPSAPGPLPCAGLLGHALGLMLLASALASADIVRRWWTGKKATPLHLLRSV